MDFILIDIGSGFGNEALESFVTEQSYNGIVGIADRGILNLLVLLGFEAMVTDHSTVRGQYFASTFYEIQDTPV